MLLPKSKKIQRII